jgi:hypothetical protein
VSTCVRAVTGPRRPAFARTHCRIRVDAVFTASAGKCGRGRTSGRKGRPDGHFHPKTSVMTSLLDCPITMNCHHVVPPIMINLGINQPRSAQQHVIGIIDLRVANDYQGNEVWDTMNMDLNIHDQSHWLYYSLICHTEFVWCSLGDRQSQPQPFLFCDCGSTDFNFFALDPKLVPKPEV